MDKLFDEERTCNWEWKNHIKEDKQWMWMNALELKWKRRE